HVTWIVLLAHSWSLHGLNKIVNRFLEIFVPSPPGWVSFADD
ncbi:sugar ABC transporter permease, partial [Xanthomonas oryzae pv. oryzae]